jgi:hypothetical protein
MRPLNTLTRGVLLGYAVATLIICFYSPWRIRARYGRFAGRHMLWCVACLFRVPTPPEPDAGMWYSPFLRPSEIESGERLGVWFDAAYSDFQPGACPDNTTPLQRALCAPKFYTFSPSDQMWVLSKVDSQFASFSEGQKKWAAEELDELWKSAHPSLGKRIETVLAGPGSQYEIDGMRLFVEWVGITAFFAALWLAVEAASARWGSRSRPHAQK